METIVCKFGGTSTAGAEQFEQIAGILRANPHRRYIVLSAPGALKDGPKVTDLLYQGKLEEAASRFDAIGSALHIPGAGEYARRTLKEAEAVSPAHLVSRGEMLCAALFSRFSGIPFVDAGEIIRFDDEGQLNVPETLCCVQAMSRAFPRAVIPGFYGRDPRERTVLFPRNGSDITGALVAAGVGAALYENWTDVPGLMTEDPAVHPDARVIPRTTYAEMRRMAEGGARVLHPYCLAPVARAGIPTRLKCTAHPEAPGTLIQ